MPNYLSLFSGIGGLDLGLDRAGWTCVGQVELDPFCRSVLERHWPEVPRHDDVRTCVDWWLAESRPAVDMVCGGFPCQPVSVAGRQRAQADERWLWPAAWAVIRDLRPAWTLLENVPGLLGRGMGDVLGDLAAIGYDAEWDCVPAAALGAPHRRDRVFVVAYPDREPRRVQPVAEPGGDRAAVAGDDGTDGHVAHPDRQRQLQPGRVVGEERRRAGDGRQPVGVADAAGTRRTQALRAEPAHGEVALAGRQALFGGRAKPERQPWWATEPGMGRVAHGIPGRVDRLRALGNAVVPQVAEHVGRLLMAVDRV